MWDSILKFVSGLLQKKVCFTSLHNKGMCNYGLVRKKNCVPKILFDGTVQCFMKSVTIIHNLTLFPLFIDENL